MLVVMMKEAVTQGTSHLIVVGVWTVVSEVLVSDLLPPHRVFSDGWCDMAGGTGHMLQVKGGRDYCYHHLTDKIVDVVLLFLVCYTHSLIVERLGGLVGLVQKMLGVERRSLGESCLADRHCEALLVCYIGNESPDSAGKLLCSWFAFYVNVLLFCSCRWSMRALNVGYWTECCCCSVFTAVLLLLCLFLFQAKGDYPQESHG